MIEPQTEILKSVDRANSMIEMAKRMGGLPLLEALLMAAAREIYVDVGNNFIAQNRIHGAIQQVSDYIMTLPVESDTSH